MLASAPPLNAQAPAPTATVSLTPAAAPATPPPIKIGNATLSINARARVENWNWFETPGFDDNYTFGALLLRAGLSRQKPKLDWQFEIAQPSLVNLPDNALAAGALGHGANYFAANRRRNDAGIFVKQAFVRFKGPGGSNADSVRLGRFEFNEGMETAPKDATLAWLKNQRITARLLNTFAFTHVQRSFDGLHYIHNTPTTNVTAVAARLTEGVFQVDGNGQVNTEVLYGALTKPLASGEGRLFALHYMDDRNVPKTGNTATTGDVKVTTLGAHYLRTFPMGAGKGDLLLWGPINWATGGRSTTRGTRWLSKPVISRTARNSSRGCALATSAQRATRTRRMATTRRSSRTPIRRASMRASRSIT